MENSTAEPFCIVLTGFMTMSPAVSLWTVFKVHTFAAAWAIKAMNAFV